MSSPYRDDFLLALAKWQRGWHEDKHRRLQITSELESAIDANRSAFPPSAFDAPSVCFRKRFLVPNNPQNGGDFWPFVWDGEIAEGVASWTIDYGFAKSIFKTEVRPNEVAVIFSHSPKPEEVVLNITNIWQDERFVVATDRYAEKNGEASAVYSRIGNKQKEVVLRAPLSIDSVRAFCGVVPRIEAVCASAGISDDADADRVWESMVSRQIFPFDPYWIEDQAAEAALDRFLGVIVARWEQRGWVKRRT